MPTNKKLRVIKAKDIRKLCAKNGIKVNFILSHKLAKAFLDCNGEKWLALGGGFDYLPCADNPFDDNNRVDFMYTFKDVIIG